MPKPTDIAIVAATALVLLAAIGIAGFALDAAPWAVQAACATLLLGLAIIGYRHRSK